MNTAYFDKSQSAAAFYGDDHRRILTTIARHFIGNHPAAPYQYRMDFEHGIHCNKKGQYLFDLDQRFPEAPIGSICEIKGRLWSFQKRTSTFALICNGPTNCVVNGETCYTSQPGEEGARKENRFQVYLCRGYNTFSFTAERTELGFSFSFGNTMAQWEPYLFQAPEGDREGQLGFIYSEPYLRGNASQELSWFPLQHHTPDRDLLRPCTVFSGDSAGDFYAKAALHMTCDGELHISSSQAAAPLFVYIDDKPAAVRIDSKMDYVVSVEGGEHSLILHGMISDADRNRQDMWYWVDIKNGSLKQAVPVHGYSGIWLYLGPLPGSIDHIEDLQRMDKTYYWKTDVPDGIVRVCVETELFGRFTYPMGVTLYGMLLASDYLHLPELSDYVRDGAARISEYYSYALFDREQLGFPSLNQQICWLEELDDCGSFGSLLLECGKRWDLEGLAPMSHEIADHMKHRQLRQPDGAYRRKDNTMWIDDLYMSIPFLVRYYQLTKSMEYLDEACRQLLLFETYFYMEDSQLMSHIYDTVWNKANRIPWSRGNGWVLFSLSELMEILPEDHGDRVAVVDFFHRMAEGVLKIQGANGLWHQVLDDPGTYEESSSTAMFICAFSRSLRRGYAPSHLRETLRQSIDRAWRGLTETAIDCNGNLYGVCQGSGCSFSRDYYRNLSWRYNDAHGIGIVLLAGLEAHMTD